MNDRYDELRILAYVEQEMTPAQRADFERMLAADPELSRLVEAIVADRDAVRRLPREQAPASVRDAVQRQLERDMLLDEAPASIPIRREGALRWRRAVSWVAVAAMVMLCASLVVVSLADPSVYQLSSPMAADDEAASPEPAEQDAPEAGDMALGDGELGETRPGLARRSASPQRGVGPARPTPPAPRGARETSRDQVDGAGRSGSMADSMPTDSPTARVSAAESFGPGIVADRSAPRDAATDAEHGGTGEEEAAATASRYVRVERGEGRQFAMLLGGDDLKRADAASELGGAPGMNAMEPGRRSRPDAGGVASKAGPVAEEEPVADWVARQPELRREARPQPELADSTAPAGLEDGRWRDVAVSDPRLALKLVARDPAEAQSRVISWAVSHNVHVQPLEQERAARPGPAPSGEAADVVGNRLAGAVEAEAIVEDPRPAADAAPARAPAPAMLDEAPAAPTPSAAEDASADVAAGEAPTDTGPSKREGDPAAGGAAGTGGASPGRSSGGGLLEQLQALDVNAASRERQDGAPAADGGATMAGTEPDDALDAESPPAPAAETMASQTDPASSAASAPAGAPHAMEPLSIDLDQPGGDVAPAEPAASQAPLRRVALRLQGRQLAQLMDHLRQFEDQRVALTQTPPELDLSAKTDAERRAAAVDADADAASASFDGEAERGVESEAAGDAVMNEGALESTDWSAILRRQLPLPPSTPVVEADADLLVPLIVEPHHVAPAGFLTE